MSLSPAYRTWSGRDSPPATPWPAPWSAGTGESAPKGGHHDMMITIDDKIRRLMAWPWPPDPLDPGAQCRVWPAECSRLRHASHCLWRWSWSSCSRILNDDTDLYGRNTAVPASNTGLSTQSRRLNPWDNDDDDDDNAHDDVTCLSPGVSCSDEARGSRRCSLRSQVTSLSQRSRSTVARQSLQTFTSWHSGDVVLDQSSYSSPGQVSAGRSGLSAGRGWAPRPPGGCWRGPGAPQCHPHPWKCHLWTPFLTGITIATQLVSRCSCCWLSPGYIPDSSEYSDLGTCSSLDNTEHNIILRHIRDWLSSWYTLHNIFESFWWFLNFYFAFTAYVFLHIQIVDISRVAIQG